MTFTNNRNTFWYPAAGCINNGNNGNDGSLFGVGGGGYYWSASPDFGYAHYLFFADDGNVFPHFLNILSFAKSVRCLKEHRL